MFLTSLSPSSGAHCRLFSHVLGYLCFIPFVLCWCFATSLFHGQCQYYVGRETDTDALLSELPPLSNNVVHGANPSQIRKDGNRRVPDQGYSMGVKVLPTSSLELLPM
jgi:hypothetical protein